MKKSYADVCLERARPDLYGTVTVDVVELAKRLKRACEEIKAQAQSFAEGHNNKEARRLNTFTNKLEAMPSDEDVQ